ncbi:hypothetical protein HJC23_000185 [Cyclotella cryptica]|uniref:Rubredoxin-like domain-containing protein n=1 Tax=Cyclotella cryptica TaxID=29204 RepID=A0ABD3QEU9_9STRA|eukprot:CCRYP_006362-RA/>CCRYP_006362-RA protein AED:0.05 eAED:0.05 QI:136/1/1/1/0.75/0.6/5/2324/111
MIKSLGLLIALICALASLTTAFNATPLHVTISRRHVSASNLSMIFGPPKDDGKPGDYVCKDCGYVFTKGPEAWAKLPEKGACPPCGAPKFRFKKVAKGSADGKVEVKKSWF